MLHAVALDIVTMHVLDEVLKLELSKIRTRIDTVFAAGRQSRWTALPVAGSDHLGEPMVGLYLRIREKFGWDALRQGIREPFPAGEEVPETLRPDEG